MIIQKITVEQIMNPYFEITDKALINDVLDRVEYGTLAVCDEKRAYAVPLNFVRIADELYFHGALSNKKMKILVQNPYASFSVVEKYALIDSDFSSTEGLACPATQFFKSVSMDGLITMVESREEKEKMFEALMQKLQPKGGYKPFEDQAYDKALKATAVYKLIPSNLSCKFKFGQNLSNERFEMIVEHLTKRATPSDMATIELMKEYRK
jgi:nitroimidazol reductase NimA-like FMN-containing flavoprotein (pyridoxamine 5'-phosphate oxidase superfamily)